MMSRSNLESNLHTGYPSNFLPPPPPPPPPSFPPYSKPLPVMEPVREPISEPVVEPRPRKQGRPKDVHTRQLNEQDRQRVRVLYFDGLLNPKEIVHRTGFTIAQIRLAIKAEKPRFSARGARPKGLTPKKAEKKNDGGNFVPAPVVAPQMAPQMVPQMTPQMAPQMATR